MFPVHTPVTVQYARKLLVEVLPYLSDTVYGCTMDALSFAELELWVVMLPNAYALLASYLSKEGSKFNGPAAALVPVHVNEKESSSEQIIVPLRNQV